ncbi:hypothetical protein B0F90DRAFT_907908 [Multifurca ochricompacta]|uniref:Uncharacterized protein n=1 Tax=Multifurca ochricompacta TaxID=376703 RepID=A0AAD4LTA3_9AGAM|nr:hypothetical protein B0F90DRAFT_907908 [Multifurca ochricompacta]
MFGHTHETKELVGRAGVKFIINHCQWGSDILILLHNAPPSLIPTADNTHNRANELGGCLLGAQKKYFLKSKRCQHILGSGLEDPKIIPSLVLPNISILRSSLSYHGQTRAVFLGCVYSIILYNREAM